MLDQVRNQLIRVHDECWTPARKGASRPSETLEERWLLEAQTARNLEGCRPNTRATSRRRLRCTNATRARASRATCRTADWWRSMKSAAALDEAERVLRRAIEVLGSQPAADAAGSARDGAGVQEPPGLLEKRKSA